MITSTANKRVRELTELGAKARARNAADVFLVEGRKLFLEAPPEQLEAIYIEETFLQEASAEVKEKLEALPESVPCEIVSSEVFRKISDTMTPQGILCVVKQFHYGMDSILGGKKAGNPLIMLLEDLQDPGNLGTIIRTAEGAGVSGVIMSRNTVDIYNPKTIRATMGSIYRVPFLVTDNLQQTIQELQKEQIGIYAAHLAGTQYYDELDYCGGTAFLIGNEGNGLRKETADAADTYVRIPMEGQVESLNAAIAATLFMYEAGRQRRKQV